MDYKKLGTKIGLELHQQIDGHKLFCNCPCIIKDSKPDFEIKRRLRASASELGELDPAALYELQKGKYFIYEGYNDVNCLIELDDQPPNNVNKEALKIALQVSLLLNCKIVDIVQFMRKVVIDGSNVSAFQRSGLIATDGYLETSKGKVRIDTICLEEEAAKKVEDTEKYRRYNLSRLGIPLIEIATAPDIKDPEHAKETAGKIGMILRSVKGMKRGLGTIRQDVNVSIKKGARTEIKGFQDYRNIPKVIDYEIKRQLDLIKKKKKVEKAVRKTEPDFTTSYLRPMPGAARMYVETDVSLVPITKEMLKSIELPELISEKVEKLIEEFGIEEFQARTLVKKDLAEYFGNVVLTSGVNPKFVAEFLISFPKEVKKLHNIGVEYDEFLIGILEHLNAGTISRNSLEKIFLDRAKGVKFKIDNYRTVSDEDLEKEIKKLVEKHKGLNFGSLMGEVMKKFKGNVDGKKASQILNKLLKKS